VHIVASIVLHERAPLRERAVIDGLRHSGAFVLDRIDAANDQRSGRKVSGNVVSAICPNRTTRAAIGEDEALFHGGIDRGLRNRRIRNRIGKVGSQRLYRT
jgi:hypothetical protein